MVARRVSCGFTLAAAFVAVPLRAQSIVRVDVANDGSESPGLSGGVDVSDDGTKVIFWTDADGLDPADVNGFYDVLLRDLVAETTTLVSVGKNGEFGDGDSRGARISGDGKFVAFASAATNLVGNDVNQVTDVFLRDLVAGTTRRVSVADDESSANGPSGIVAISGDGNRVLFVSDATNLVAGDTNGRRDLFLRDVAAKTTIRVSVAADGTEGDGEAQDGDLSRDGQFAVFVSDSTNLVPGDTNQWPDAFVCDLATGAVERVSVRSDGSELEYGGGIGISGVPTVAISADGRFAAFTTFQYDVVPGDDNGTADAFLRDRSAGTTTPVSVDSNGQFADAGVSTFGSFPSAITADGRFVLFQSTGRLASGDDGDRYRDDVYVRDGELAMTTRQSNTSSGIRGDDASGGARMSADGSRVAFVSRATDLIAGHPMSGSCALLLTRPLRAPASSIYGAGLAGSLGVPALALAAPPLLNQPYDVSIGNSSAQWTVALLLIGTQQVQIPTRLGGDLLVDPLWTQLLVLPSGGDHVTGTMPPEERLASMSLELQALQLDAGAVRGVSFTPGLEIQAGF